MPEAVVAREGELQDGEMKQVAVGETDVLLARVDGRYHAVGNACTHYGAPLSNGVLLGSRVVCPWHHSCYSVVSGDLEEPPGLDSLPRYDVRLDGKDILVAVPDGAPEQRTLPPVKADLSVDAREFVIVGGGAAGAAAVEALREAGFRGRIVLLTAESRLPYDRTLLSKAYLAKGDDQGWIPMRPAAFYRERDIEIMERTVSRLNAEAQTLRLSDGTTLHYDALLLAPGSIVRRPDVPGAHLERVLLLRTPEDSDRIVAAAEAGRRAVVIGASWIGMECAAGLRARDVEVTVVAPEQVPFEKILGTEAGQALQKLHEDNGVTFQLGVEVARLEGTAAVERVVLQSGDTLGTDFVVAGVGVRPATEFLGALTNEDGSVSVDEQLRVRGAPGQVYAAGDIARFPAFNDGEIRIEHWRVAMQHGRVAALNMAGRDQRFDDAPFFWTQQYGKSFRYVGHVEQTDETIVDGNLDGLKALVYYVSDGQLQAALGVGRDPDICAIRELMRLDRLPSPAELRQGVDWVSLLGTLT